MDNRSASLRAALELLYYSGAYRALKPLARGQGAIFMLHRVLPGAHGTAENAFDPNAFLAVSPEFLDRTIARVKASGFDLVSLDEAVRRISQRDGGRFACFTLDDGYRDNRDHALPVFEKHGCPFAVYVTSGFASREVAPWWVMLERLIARQARIVFEVDGAELHIPSLTTEEKYAAYTLVSGQLSALPGANYAAAIGSLASRYSFDTAALADELTMDWDELRGFGAHSLVTLGAHTVSHPVLANLDDADCREEMDAGAREMQNRLGSRPRHFAYPYGHGWAAGAREFALGRELEFVSGVTTRKGLVYGEHAGHEHALPRVSLNGDYQQDRYIDVLLSGAAFALLNRFRRVNAA